MTATDTVTLQPVLPASGLSACPGQNVTLNCTVNRTDNTLAPPIMTWIYRSIYGIRSDGTSTNSPHDIFTATFAGNYTVISNATILSVPLSYHNSTMICRSPIAMTAKSVTISITGNRIDKHCISINFVSHCRCSKLSIKP